MAFYHSVFSGLAKNDIEELVMGIAHRGRLNLMTCMLNLDPVLLFAKVIITLKHIVNYLFYFLR